MPVIRVSEPTFQRLQAIARPFEDTPSSVIDLLLDLHEDVEAAKPAALKTRVQAKPAASESKLAPWRESNRVPELTHARIVTGSFAGRVVRNWNDLIHVAHRVAFAQLKNFDKVQSMSKSHILRGHFRGGGFRHLKDLNISIQNVSANDAWRRALHMAKTLGVTVQMEVEWEHKSGAAHPGQRRKIGWQPDQSDRRED
jgi:hypothetical protein